MKANELRIWNWVQREDKTFQVDGGDIKAMQDWQKLEDEKSVICPIPLTEEWLLKFGFEKSDNTPFYDYFVLEFGIGLCYDVYSDSYFLAYQKNHYTKTNIKYVHQLQNLYFALTNEELTIK